MVCELEFKYGANYTKAFAIKQLARYVLYEALDVYKQHFPKILAVTQIPNPTYAIAIAIHCLLSYITNYHCTSWDYAQ
jgi:hypothetical protein